MDMSDNFRFIYMPASALASRRIIEQSSYTTTPDQSPADATPPCGEAVYKRSLDAEKIKTVDLILQMEQTTDAQTFEPCSKETSSVEGNTKTGNKPVDREDFKKGKKSAKENLDVSKLSITLELAKK